MQWLIYIEAKEAVLEGPQTQGAPKFVIKKWRQNNDTAFNTILMKLLI